MVFIKLVINNVKVFYKYSLNVMKLVKLTHKGPEYWRRLGNRVRCSSFETEDG